MNYKKIINELRVDLQSKGLSPKFSIGLVEIDEEKNKKAINKIKKQYSLLSENYISFLEKYQCFALGWGVFLTSYNYSEKFSIDYGVKEFGKLVSICYKEIFPIGININDDKAGDAENIIFLNNRGQVIKFIGSIITEKPRKWQTYCSKKNLEEGLDIAYLDYYDEFAGGYREYRVLGNSFGQFMDECIFGERYLEFAEEDAFYNYIKDLKKRLKIQDVYRQKRFADGSIHHSMGKQIEDQLKNAPSGATIDEFNVKIIK
jgi:hypothetical protein